MSRPTSTRSGAAKEAKATPRARAMRASSWSGTVPRMSYALTIGSRGVMTVANPSGRA